MPKIKGYKITIKDVPEIDEMGMSSSFDSKLAFVKSNTSTFLLERDSAGTLVVDYGHGYNNEFPFSNYKELKSALNAGTEKELVNEFAG